MSQENVEIVRRFTEAFNNGDVEAVLAYSHPEIEFIPLRATIQGAYRGHSGLREYFADTAENLDVLYVAIDERPTRGDRIVVNIGTLRIRGKGSGVEVTVPTAAVFTVHDGKVARVEDFGDRTAALAAADLSEQDAHGDS
jgi:ketosteroid isomerase-like protein